MTNISNPGRTSGRVGPLATRESGKYKRPASRSTIARRLAAVGVAASLFSLLIFAGMHLLPPTSLISPVHRTVSEYGLSSSAWAFNGAVGCLAVGSAAVFVAVIVARAMPLYCTATVFSGLWILGLVTVIVFPKHNWAVGPSTSGEIHRMASLVAFLALPCAVLAIGRAVGRRLGRSRPVPIAAAMGLAYLALALFLPIVVAIASQGETGTRWWLAIPLGLIERGIALSEVLAVLAVGYALIGDGAPGQVRPPPATPGQSR